MRNRNRAYICLLILLLVFSLIAFAVPLAKTGTFWTAYLFALVASALQIYIFHTAFAGDDSAKSRFYGFPIAKIGIVYLLVQLVSSMIEMAASAVMPVWVAIVINVLLLAVTLIGCITSSTVKEEIVRQDMKLKENVSNMRALQSLSSALVGQCNDKEMKETLRRMAERFKFSDPISSKETEELEEDMQKQMDEIQRAVIDGDNEAVKDLCDRILSLLKERNRICVLNK